ncbi:MAG: class I tRNA ligase family protein, partial [Terriglobales bacterium]
AYRVLADFCTVELSAFYLDVLKDRLYTSAPQGAARRSAQTVLWRMLDLLVRLFAPLLPFTTEEIWETMGAAGLREGAGGSVHEQVFAEVRAWFPAGLDAPDEDARWERLMVWREAVLQALERARQEKRIGTSLEAQLELRAAPPDAELLAAGVEQLPALFIVSQVCVAPAPPGAAPEVRVLAAAGRKCERCWNYSEAVGADATHPTLCDRCTRALAEMGAAAAR